MNKVSTAFLLCAMIAMFFGCTPEETHVIVNASALKKATAGELASAQVEVVFNVDSKDEDLPRKIKSAALPYLGEGGTIELEKTVKRKFREGGRESDREREVGSDLDDAKLIGNFTIPVGNEHVLRQAKRSILCLKYNPESKTFVLVAGSAMPDMNTALCNVNDDVAYQFEGGNTTIKIMCDEEIQIGVAAVHVNGDPVVAGPALPDSGKIIIKYGSLFYEKTAPCFTVGSVATVKSETIEARRYERKHSSSSWLDDF